MSLWSVSGCTSRGCTSCRGFFISRATGDGTLAWSNAAALDLFKKALLLFMLNCAGCEVGFGCYHATHVGLGSYGSVLVQISARDSGLNNWEDRGEGMYCPRALLKIPSSGTILFALRTPLVFIHIFMSKILLFMLHFCQCCRSMCGSCRACARLYPWLQPETCTQAPPLGGQSQIDTCMDHT